MPKIVTNEYFINDLFIPSGQAVPSIGDGAPSDIDELNDCCVVVEKRLLQNALGLTIYNELQVALVDIANADQKWKDLVNGIEYDGRVWEGLKAPKTFIAYAVYYYFLNSNSEYYATFGVVKPEAANSVNVTPAYKLTSAWNTFLQKYQRGNCTIPRYYSGVGWELVDWYGNHDGINVSLFEFLRDKASDYGWAPEYFKYYESVNTFGI